MASLWRWMTRPWPTSDEDEEDFAQPAPSSRRGSQAVRRSRAESSLPSPFVPYSTLTSTGVPCSRSLRSDSLLPCHRERSSSLSPPRSHRSISPSTSPSPSPTTRRTSSRPTNQLLYRPASTLITIDEVDSNASSVGTAAGTPVTSIYGSFTAERIGMGRRRSSLGQEAERMRSVSPSDEEDDFDVDESQSRRRGLKRPISAHQLRRRDGTGVSPTERSRLLSARGSRSSSSRSSTSGDESADDEEKLPPVPWHQTPLFVAGVKLGILFLLFTAVLAGTLYFGVPRLERDDRPALKVPRSFADLQALNKLFQKYKHLYPFKILACGVVTYLFVQAFSLPGSMYISILFGAAYGIMEGLLLSCLCEACGAVLCYTLSAIVGPPLLAIPSYRNRLETWRIKIMGDESKGERVGWDGVFAFLIVLRIAPFPPHWIANVVAPHLGISPLLFWLACFIGIAPVSVIHVTIGSGLDSMTSAEDFHILSLRNVLGLVGVGVAVLIPVGLKRVFKKDLSGLSDAEAALADPHGAKITLEESGSSAAASITDEPYSMEPEEYSYQAQDSGVVLSPPRNYVIDEEEDRGSRYAARDKGKGRANDVHIKQALDIIQNDEDEEVVAVVYDDEIDEIDGSKLEGLYEAVGEAEPTSDTDDEGDFPFEQSSRYNVTSGGRARGYGTIQGREEDDQQIDKQAKSSWWTLWR